MKYVPQPTVLLGCFDTLLQNRAGFDWPVAEQLSREWRTSLLLERDGWDGSFTFYTALQNGRENTLRTFITAVRVSRCFPEALWATLCLPGVVFCCTEAEDKSRQIRIPTNEQMMTRLVRSPAVAKRRLISFESAAVYFRKAASCLASDPQLTSCFSLTRTKIKLCQTLTRN